MKNLCSCLFILTLFSSCSNDGTNATDDQTAVIAQPENTVVSANRNANEMPANSDNLYDYAGKMHNEILYNYYNGSPLPAGLPTVRDRVMIIANATAGFNESKSALYQEIPLIRVQSILNSPTTCINDVISGTGMSVTGKTSLNAFTISLLTLVAKENEYKPIYESICNYESTVINDMLLTQRDKKTILTTTSIARFAIYAARKRPKKNTDPDWTIFIGNIAAGTFGGDTDIASAVASALITGIAQN